MNGSELVVYMDASAMVKLAVNEAESPAMRDYVRRHNQFASSALIQTEVLRRASFHGPGAVLAARRSLAPLTLITIDADILEVAALLRPLELRTLDAIHLASALSLGTDLGEVVTYDRRMQEAARALGLAVASPA